MRFPRAADFLKSTPYSDLNIDIAVLQKNAIS